MKHAKAFLFAAAILVLMPLVSSAAEVKVIANPSVAASSISSADIQAVFLLDKDSFGGSHVEPVLAKSGAAHEAFLKAYLGKNDSALQAFYRSLVFTGKASMPKSLSSDADIVAYVARTKGAIGYVSSSASISGVKVLEVR